MGSTAMIKGVVFSKQRPLQLEACLRSFYSQCTDAGLIDLAVLYVAEEGYTELYARVALDFPEVKWIREVNFKDDLLAWVYGDNARPYVLFMVDDCLWASPFRLLESLSAMEEAQALAFSYRLGVNIVDCYTAGAKQAQPAFIRHDYVLTWDWQGAERDWGYPADLSSSLYRKADVYPTLSGAAYANPNQLEDALRVGLPARPRPMVCFEYSVAFCAPVNMVQTCYPGNRHGDNPALSVGALREAYSAGLRLRVSNLPTPTAPHQEIQFDLYRPDVSIIVPFNRTDFLDQTLASVWQQRFQSLEVILVDDGCPTSPYPRLHKAAWRVDQMRYYRLEGVGPTLARTYGFKRAYGTYLLPLDSDDLITADYLSKMVPALEAQPADAALAYCDTIYFGNGTPHGFRQPEWSLDKLAENNFLSYCSLMRASAYNQVGYDLNNWGYSEDWQLFLRLGNAGYRGVHVPEVLFHYRQSNGQLTGRANPALARAYIVTTLPGLYTPEQVAQAQALLDAMPAGWHRRKP